MNAAGSNSEGGVKEIEEALWSLLVDDLSRYGGIDREHLMTGFLAPDLKLNAAGIAHYFERMKKR